MIDLVFFDFDGVILESVDVKTRAFSEMFERYGRDVRDQVVAYHLMHGGVSRFDKIRHFHREFLGRDITEQELRDECGRFSGLVLEEVKSSPFVPGALEFLQENFTRYRCFVVSGTPTDELAVIVHARGLGIYFERLYGAPAKKADIVADILSSTAIAPGRALLVGDSITDYDAARANGVIFLGRVPQGELNPFPDGTAVMPDLTGLATFVKEASAQCQG